MLKSKQDMQAFLQHNQYSQDFDTLIKACINQKNRASPKAKKHAKEAVLDAIRALSCFSNQLDAHQILDKAMQLDLGTSSVDELQQALEEYINKEVLLKTNSGHFTSMALIEREIDLDYAIGAILKSSSTTSNNPPTATMDGAWTTHRICILQEPQSLQAKMEMLDTLIHQMELRNKKVTLLTPTKNRAAQYNARCANPSDQAPSRAQGLPGFLRRYKEAITQPEHPAFIQHGKEVFIIEDSQRISLDAVEQLITWVEQHDAQLIFLSYDAGRKSSLSGNTLAFMKQLGVPSIPAPFPITHTQTLPFDCQIHEIKAELNTPALEKQRHRQQKIASKLVAQYRDALSKVQVFSSTRHSASKLSDLIREALQKNKLIGQQDRDITVEKPVYLTPEEKKHAKFFKKGMIAKTYIGKGKFSQQVISQVDRKNNCLQVRSESQHEQSLSPAQFLESSNTRLYEQKKLPLVQGDRIRLDSDNPISRQIGLSLNTGYHVKYLGKKKVILIPDNKPLKKIKTPIRSLQGLNITHDYVKTLNQNTSMTRENKHAILEAPAYALTKNIINELERSYARLSIYTDDQHKAEKKIGVHVTKTFSLDLRIVSSKDRRTPSQQAIAYGLSIVASREAAFPYQSLIEKALSYSVAQIRHTDIKKELAQAIRAGELQARQTSTGEILLATQEAIALENTIIEQIKTGKNAVTPFMGPTTIAQKLAHTTLTPGQKNACVLLASTSDRFVMVQGYAGTGKSTLLKTLKGVLEANTSLNHHDIIALAPTHKAVKALTENNMPAQTLKRFLINEPSFIDENFQSLKNKLILLDESSMVSNSDFNRLQSLVEQATSCHCAYIGDIAQLSPVEAGKPSELAYIAKQADIAIATMDEVLRQKNPELKAIATQFMRGTAQHVEKACDQLEKVGWVKEQKKALDELAKDYVQLTTEERHHTLIAVATHHNRHKLNQAIRAERLTQKELTGPEIITPILTDSSLTHAEQHHASNYQPGNIVRIHHQYLDVCAINHTKNSLVLKDPSGQAKILNLNWIPKNTPLELFHTQTIQIRTGDELRWTKNDKDHQITAHERLRVVKVDSQKYHIIAHNESDQPITIDLNQRHNQHIDYHYTSTIHGLQGATAKRVMIFANSKNRNANTMRLMYVAITRSTHHARIYTDDFATIRRQITHTPGGNISALEAMDLLDKKNNQPPQVNLPPDPKKETPAKNPPKPSIVKKPYIDAKILETELRHQVKRICDAVLGSPNRSLSNSRDWRYGQKGSLSVKVSGQYQGSFCNFETEEKGGMIQLIMSELGIDFKRALEEGQQMLGGSAAHYQRIAPPSTSVSSTKTPATDARKMAYIQTLIKQSQPIEGTLAQHYLANRCIKNTKNTELRFIKKINTGGGNKDIVPFASALLAIAKDKNGAIKAVQATYLDPKIGTKITSLPIKKRTIGSLKEAFVTLNAGAKPPPVAFVAEGIETALSIKDVLQAIKKDQIQVIATLGKSNLAKIAHENSPDKIVLVLDNDKHPWQQDRTIQSAITTLIQQGKQVTCIQPKLLHDQKTDYNDIAQSGKLHETGNDINQALFNLYHPDKINALNKLTESQNEKTRSSDLELSR